MSDRPLPPATRVVCSDAGLRVEFEPLGVRDGARGLERRAMRSGLGTTLFSSAVVPIAALQYGSREPNFVNEGGIVVLGMALLAMWALLLALVLQTLELATRRTTVGVVDGVLLVERRSCIARRRTRVPLVEVESLRVEPVYAPLHQRALDCLVVHRRGADALPFLAERPRADLEWLVGRLTPYLSRARA